MENKSGALILLIMLIVSAFVILMVKLAAYIRHFNRETRRIIMKMQRAADEKEYCYWHKMLRCHYLCLIPFVNERNVSGAYSFFFHQPKRAEKETRIDGVFHILAPSLAAFCLCAVCLCGASWAWFTASSGIGAAKVQAATYTVEIKYKATDTNVWQDGEYQISLDGGKTYELRITPAETATATDGFCDVTIGDITYQTDQIPKDSIFAFSVEVQGNEKATLTITPKWGTGSDTNKIDPTYPIVYGTAQSEGQESSLLLLAPANGSEENSAPSAPALAGENNASSVDGENSAQGGMGPAAEENQADPQEAGAGEEKGSPGE